MTPSAEKLASALVQLPPRQARLLLRAAKAPLHDVASNDGVSTEASGVTILRALEALAARLGQTPPPAADDDEAARAAALTSSLSGVPSSPLGELLRRLGQDAAAVEERVEALRRAQDVANEPRERWLRRAFLVLVAVAAVLYVRHEGPGWLAWLESAGFR